MPLPDTYTAHPGTDPAAIMQHLPDPPIARYGYVVTSIHPDGTTVQHVLPGSMTRAGVAGLIRLARDHGRTVTYRLARSPLPEYA